MDDNLYKADNVDFQFFKPTSDDFEDNFFGCMVEVSASYLEDEDTYVTIVAGVGDLAFRMETTDVEVQNEALLEIMELDVVTFASLETIGFENT